MLIHRNDILLLLLLPFQFAVAQNKSNKGKEFWLGYGHNVLFTQGANSQTHVLYLSAEQAATVTVSVNGTLWSQTVNIPANTVDYSITIPKSGAGDARLMNEGLSDRGIHIISDAPIVAYSHQYGLFSSAGMMLMPVETYGYTYYSLNYTQISNYTDSYSWFYVVAAEDNTRLLITPSDSTEGGWLPDQTYTVNLNKGQVYNVFGKKTGNYTGKDMTGSKVVSVVGTDGSCHPVAFFCGSSRNIICDANGGEVMQQQMFPANAWGTKYLTYHTINTISNPVTDPFMNIYRVAVRDPSTIVKRNGIVLTGLINNFYYEFSSNTGDYIEADGPVLVAQFSLSTNECSGTNPNPYGDPEMIYLSPVEQGVKNAIFYNTRNQAIDYNFLNIIVPTAGAPSMRIDGAAPLPSELIPHPANSNYTVVIKRLLGPGAQHSISCDSTFIASLYGSGITESYGYNVGTYVNNLNAVTSIQNVFNSIALQDTFTCTKSPFRLFITVAYKAEQVHWYLSQVPGLNPSADSVLINPVPLDSSIINSRKYYTYTLQQDFILNNTGTYILPFSYSAPGIDACSQTEYDELRVEVRRGPVVNFNTNSPVCLKDSVYFTGVANTNGYAINDYLWIFDDDSVQATINAVKKYSFAGDHLVQYRLISTNGCVGDTTKLVTVHDSPVASFTIVPGIFCENKPVQFSSGLAGIATWNWDFGNGTGNNVPPFNRVYNTAQSYVISLSVTNTDGCSSIPVTNSLTINHQPIIDAGPDKAVNPGETTLLDATTDAPALYNFDWSPSLYLSDAAVLNPLCTAGQSTEYIVSATDKNSGCFATDKVKVNVISGLYIPAAFTPNNDGINDVWRIPGLLLHPGAEVILYNRYGEIVYRSKDNYSYPWDGTYKGVKQPTGSFVYIVKLNDVAKTILKGNLTLVR